MSQEEIVEHDFPIRLDTLIGQFETKIWIKIHVISLDLETYI